MIQVSPQVAVMLVLAFLGCVFAFGRILLQQFERRMNERFTAIDKTHALEVSAVQGQQQADGERLARLIDEVRILGSNLPLQYVRREDWIRFSSSIDHKLDRLAELVMKTGLDRA